MTVFARERDVIENVICKAKWDAFEFFLIVINIYFHSDFGGCLMRLRMLISLISLNECVKKELWWMQSSPSRARKQTSWRGSVHSTVVLLLYGCLFKPSRVLPRRDCHAWANLRTQNQILLRGKRLVVCQDRFCSLYLNNQANQAWPPSPSMEDPYMPTLSPRVCLCHSVSKLCNPNW